MSDTIKKFGDWDIVGLLTSQLANDCKHAAQLSVRRFALKCEGLAKRHISNQDLPWQPLNEEYLAAKVRRGFSNSIMVQTSTYFQSITSWTEKAGLTGLAGVKRGVFEKSETGEEIEVANIAKIQEYGSEARNIPARPLWRPVLVEASNWHRKENEPGMLYMDMVRKKYRAGK